jgi:hypothetical protein
MGPQFARVYRSALLDYLLGNGAVGEERAFGLGRRAIGTGVGLLQILFIHHYALNTILESTHGSDDRLKVLLLAQRFLAEALAPFEMTHRGYMEGLAQSRRTMIPPCGPT